MFSGSKPMMAKAVIDFPQPDSPTTPRLLLLSSVKLRLSKMLIGPDGCSVRTVKLLTVNKFKWLSLEVIFLEIVKISQNAVEIYGYENPENSKTRQIFF